MPPHAFEAQRLAEQLRARGDHGDQPEPMFDVPAGEPDRLAAVRTAVAEQRAQLAWGSDRKPAAAFRKVNDERTARRWLSTCDELLDHLAHVEERALSAALEQAVGEAP